MLLKKCLLRIYFFANGHTGPNQDSGGEKRFREIVKRLNGFDKTVISSKFGFDVYKKDSLPIRYILSSISETEQNIVLMYFKRTLSSLFIDIPSNSLLYSISDILPDVFPPFWHKLVTKNLKWVQVIHHLYPHPRDRQGNKISNYLGYIFQRICFVFIRINADLIIVVNPLVKQQLTKLGFNKNKILVSSNGIDLKKIQSFQKSNECFDAVFLGRLNASKGVFDLIKIWQNLMARQNDLKLAIIGNGTKQVEGQLKEIISKNRLEKNIVSFGYLEDERAFGVIKTSKIFVFPSHEEGFGIVILEAMACGVPVIAYDLPAYKEIFPKGLIKVPIGDFKLFADSIISILTDSKKYIELQKDAQELASNYSWDKIAMQETNNLYKIIK
jgi:glycosyltransferase involved in cell wall biosynthesis